MAEDSNEATTNEPTRNETTQGHAVKQALNGDRNEDIDRWAGFSKEKARERAKTAPPLKPAE